MKTNVTERYVLLLLVLVFGFVGTYSNISTNQKKYYIRKSK